MKKPTINKVVSSVESLSVYLRGISKFGKSTLVRDVILEKYGDPSRGLLISVANEMGYKLLDNLNYVHVDTFEELLEYKDWLIKEKGKEHQISMVAIDVISEVIPLLEAYVCKLSFKETGKLCKSINSAFGGYGSGQKKMELLLKQYFSELFKAGISVWCIGHTKVKSIKEKASLDEEGYQVLTSDLPNNLEAVITGMFDVILTGVVDKNIQDKKVTDITRKLYFRGTEFIEAGCRFGNGTVPEYIVFDKPNMAKEVIQTLEEGMRKSNSHEVSQEEFKAKQKKEIEELDKKAEEFIKSKDNIGMTPEEKAEAHSKIKTNLASIDMAELQRIMKDYSITDFKDAQAIPDGAYKELLDLLD